MEFYTQNHLNSPDCSLKPLVVSPPMLKEPDCSLEPLVVSPPLPPMLEELVCSFIPLVVSPPLHFDNQLPELPPLTSGVKKLYCHSERLLVYPPFPLTSEEARLYGKQFIGVPPHSGSKKLYYHNNK